MPAPLSPASPFPFSRDIPDEVAPRFRQLYELVLAICPDCLVGRREDNAFIFVPELHQGAHEEGLKNKNLITVWVNSQSVRYDIRDGMAEAREVFDGTRVDDVRDRLNQRLTQLG